MRGMDLFSGLGVASLAMEAVGIEVVAHSEVEPFPNAVLEERFPGVPNYGDVTKFGEWPWGEIGHIDVVTSGSPCQDLSVAGKRAGLSGERSGLFYDAVGAFRRSGARFFVWENVVGAMSSNRGRDFGSVLDSLAEAGAVDICWRVLDAQGFGVPQRRRRVFLVADFGGERAREVLFEREGESRDFAPGREARQKAAGESQVGAGAGHGGGFLGIDSEFNVSEGSVGSLGALSRSGGGNPAKVAEPMESPKAECLDARSFNSRGDMSGTLQSKPSGGYSLNCINPVVEDREDGEAWGLKQGQTKSNGCGVKKGATHSLDGSSAPAVAFHITQDPVSGESSPALTGGNSEGCATIGVAVEEEAAIGFSAGNSAQSRSMCEGEEVSPPLKSADSGSNRTPSVAKNMRVRKLTPVEAERLQGLPDGFTDIVFNGKPAFDSPRYRALGNSWAYPVGLFVMLGVAEALGRGES